MSLAAVIPAAPDSPWLTRGVPAALAGGAAVVYVVSEAAIPADLDAVHIAIHKDLGFAARANAGLMAAWKGGATTAVLLNDDTLAKPGALSRLALALRDEDVAAAGAILLNEDGSLQSSGMSVDLRSGRIKTLRQPVQGEASRDAVSGAAFALSKESWERLRGFSDRFSFYFEDVDFCLRARGLGKKVLVVGDAQVIHHGGGTRSGTSPEAAWHLGRNHVLLARRMGGGPLHQAARLATVSGLAVAWTLRSVGPLGLPRLAAGLAEGIRVDPEPL